MTDAAALLAHVSGESDRFLEAISAASPEASVPTCPGWTADDLLWHLAEVQFFWATIVARRPGDPEPAEAAKPDRPADRAGLVAFFRQSSDSLRRTLATTPVETPVWTWSADRTARFVCRRQAHEALIHRIDAELTTGTRSGMDPGLAADGVDEILRVMYGETPTWGQLHLDADEAVRLRAVDAKITWRATLARFVGTDPDSRISYDEPVLAVDAADTGAPVKAEIHADGEDLDCWLWRRPTRHPIARSGDPVVLDRFERRIKAGIQ